MDEKTYTGWPTKMFLFFFANNFCNNFMPQVFKCSAWEVCHTSWTEHLNTWGITSHGTDSFRIKPITPGHPIPKISTGLTIFWGGTWKTVCENNPQTREDIIRREIRWITQERLNRVVDNLMFDLLLCCHTAARSMERT